MSRIAVVGSIAMDLISRASRLPKPGETIIGHSFSQAPGGKGANQAAAAGRLEADVLMVGCVGADGYGTTLQARLRDCGVDTSHIKTAEAPTGIAAIWVEESGQNSIIVSPGANHHLSAQHVHDALQATEPSIVVAQCEIPLEAIDAASRFGRFILNPAPVCDLPEELLGRCWMLIPNEVEASQLVGQPLEGDDTIEKAAAALLALGPEHVVVTLGAKGAYWASRSGDRLLVPALPVTPVDTTAAGDAFVGALCAALALNHPMDKALNWACAAASLSTTKPGAMPSLPNRQEVEKVWE